MKKIFSAFIATLAMATFTGCDDKLDIVPLGKSTLDTVTDLETLLKSDYQLGSPFYQESLCNNSFSGANSVARLLANKSSLSYVYMTYDETINRQDLTDSDSKYTKLYSMINYMNVIISKAPAASGDNRLRNQIIAEAHLKRAWYHFLLANIYAGQYQGDKAESMGGIPYVTDTDVSVQKTKQNLKYVYDRLLEDCDDRYIDDMVQKCYGDPSRGGADFGNAVKALVLFQMKRYSDALPYALKALGINGTVEDRSEAYGSGVWALDYISPNNYMLIRGDNSNLGDYYFKGFTPEVYALFDPKDYTMLLELWTTDNYGYSTNGGVVGTSADVHMNAWGIRSENMYYTAAECLIRDGQIKDGLAMIDKVREKRILNYQPLAERTDITSPAQAMQVLQDTKRVEMLMTIYNYLDRRRWNTEAEYVKDIVRDLDDYGTFTLKPESPLWIQPFPLDCLIYNSTLTPNY